MTQLGRRGFKCWADVPDPKRPDDSTWEVCVPHGVVQHCQKHRHVSKLFGLAAVDFVLRDPKTIFKGWNRDRTEECWVYVGWPPRKRRDADVDLPSDKTQLFMVYVFPDGSVQDWEWRKRSEEDLWKPEGVDGEIWRAS